MQSIYINDYELDQLKESVNIGASHASDALSHLINKTVMLSVPEVNYGDIITAPMFIGDAATTITSIKVHLEKPTKGVMFYLFPDENDKKILTIINPNRKQGKDLSDEDLSTLSEIANILSGSFLTAISKFLGMDFMHSVSEIKIKNLGEVVNNTISEIVQNSETKILILKINLEIRENDIKTNLFFIMDPNFTKDILDLSQKILS